MPRKSKPDPDVFRIIDLQQKSSEWLDWRTAGIGSSDVPILMGLSQYKTREALLTEKIEKICRMQGTASTQWGNRMEGPVRKLYTEITGIECRPVVIVSTTTPWMKASLDGLSMGTHPVLGDIHNKIIQEIKCTNYDNHRLALSGQVPKEFYPQVQWQFLVSGLSRLDFISYNESGKLATREMLKVLPVDPDTSFMQEILNRCTEDWNYINREVLQKVPNAVIIKDFC